MMPPGEAPAFPFDTGCTADARNPPAVPCYLEKTTMRHVLTLPLQAARRQFLQRPQTVLGIALWSGLVVLLLAMSTHG